MLFRIKVSMVGVTHHIKPDLQPVISVGWLEEPHLTFNEGMRWVARSLNPSYYLWLLQAKRLLKWNIIIRLILFFFFEIQP